MKKFMLEVFCMRKTKIICTLGPAVDTDDMIRGLMINGMDCARMNFSQYLLELRIACACRLLQESKLCISEVAINSGFNNLSNFNRQFLAKIKNTPRSYRLSCRSANE